MALGEVHPGIPLLAANMIVASFRRYLAQTGHDHGTIRRTGAVTALGRAVTAVVRYKSLYLPRRGCGYAAATAIVNAGPALLESGADGRDVLGVEAEPLHLARASPDTGPYSEAIRSRRYTRPPASIPTTAPPSSRVKKPRIPFMPPLVMMYSSPSPGSRPISSRG